MSRTPEDIQDPGTVHEAPESTNPYQRRQEGEAPDLDASAPLLNSAEAQRLNRKALFFLVALVGLLLIAAFMMFGSFRSGGDDDKPAARQQQQLVIPEAPVLPELPPVQPMYTEQEALPPLPVVQNEPERTSMMPSMPRTQEPTGPTLMERRMGDGAGLYGGAVANDRLNSMMSPEEYSRKMEEIISQNRTGSTPTPADISSRRSSVQPLYNPDTLLLRGTYIRCILESRIITDVPGFTSCVVTEPVYSVNGKRLLLPRGSKVMGSYGADAIIGKRAAIIWDRVTTPNGLDVNMSSPGVDMLGSAGNTGDYSAHWGQRISSALLVSMISDAFKYVGAKNGPESTTIENGALVQNPYESNTAKTMERMANMVLEQNMSRPPTVTINQGTVLNVYVAQDIDFTAVLR